MIGYTGNGIGDQTGNRLLAGFCSSIGGSQYKESCAIINARSITRSNGTALFFEHRLHLTEGFHGGVGLAMLIGIKDHIAFARLNGDGNNLGLEAAFFNRHASPAMGFHRKRILLITR